MDIETSSQLLKGKRLQGGHANFIQLAEGNLELLQEGLSQSSENGSRVVLTGLLSTATGLGVRLVKTRGPGIREPGQLLPTALQILQVAAGHKAEHLRTDKVGTRGVPDPGDAHHQHSLESCLRKTVKTTGRWRRPQTPLSTAAAARPVCLLTR